MVSTGQETPGNIIEFLGQRNRERSAAFLSLSLAIFEQFFRIFDRFFLLCDPCSITRSVYPATCKFITDEEKNITRRLFFPQVARYTFEETSILRIRQLVSQPIFISIFIHTVLINVTRNKFIFEWDLRSESRLDSLLVKTMFIDGI